MRVQNCSASGRVRSQNPIERITPGTDSTAPFQSRWLVVFLAAALPKVQGQRGTEISGFDSVIPKDPAWRMEIRKREMSGGERELFLVRSYTHSISRWSIPVVSAHGSVGCRL